MNCTNYFEKESNFSKPMPWIGLYIAAASLLCAFTMLADLVNGFWHHQMWIPSRYFTLNATSLTIIAVAIKLSVDLNTSMPGKIDQVAKISTSVLICISMGILTPSLGKMEDTELLSNLTALVILVMTSIVNLCIQLKTGVIYTYKGVHIFLLVSMSYLLVVCCSTAIALASIKNELRVKYERRNQLAMNELRNESSGTMTTRLEEYLIKFSIMSHTGSPHFVISRHTTWCLCLVAIILLGIATTDPYYRDANWKGIPFCNGESDYEWSTLLVLFTQLFAAVVGGITLTLKQLNASKAALNRPIGSSLLILPKVETYWTQMLIEMKKRPFFLYTRNRKCRKFIHFAKKSCCNIMIAIQVTVVLIIDVLGTFNEIYTSYGNPIISMGLHNLSSFFGNNNPHSTYPSRGNQIELRQYVLHLTGEEELIDSMMEIALNITSRYIEVGKQKVPNNLIEFLQKSLSHDYERVFRFQSIQVPPLGSEEPPPNCWSLSLATLTGIAVLLPNIYPCKVDKLLKAVEEGLVFVKIIEKNLNKNFYLINAKKAADFVWEEMDIHRKWFDIEKSKLDVQENNPINILEFLTDSAKKKFLALRPSEESTSIRQIEAVASYSLYKICQIILLDSQNRNNQYETMDDMFEMLSAMICDILGACLFNMKRSICKECSRSTIETMHETARRVLILFGRAEKIMKLPNERAIPCLDCKKLAFIDEWQHSSETREVDSPRDFPCITVEALCSQPTPTIYGPSIDG